MVFLSLNRVFLCFSHLHPNLTSNFSLLVSSPGSSVPRSPLFPSVSHDRNCDLHLGQPAKQAAIPPGCWVLLGVRETQSAGVLGSLVSCRNRTKASAVVFFHSPLWCPQKEERDCSGQAGREASRDSYHPGLQSPPWPPLQTRAKPHPGEEDPETLFLYMQVNKHIFFTKNNF